MPFQKNEKTDKQKKLIAFIHQFVTGNLKDTSSVSKDLLRILGDGKNIRDPQKTLNQLVQKRSDLMKAISTNLDRSTGNFTEQDCKVVEILDNALMIYTKSKAEDTAIAVIEQRANEVPPAPTPPVTPGP